MRSVACGSRSVMQKAIGVWVDERVFLAAGAGAFAGEAMDFAGGFTKTYGRILSSRFFEIRGITSKSLTLLNGPLFARKFRMACAVTGPTPGNSCSCFSVAVFKSKGCAGNFFFVPARTGKVQIRKAEKKRMQFRNTSREFR